MTLLEKLRWFQEEYDKRQGIFPDTAAKLHWLYLLASQLFVFGNLPKEKVQEAISKADEELQIFLVQRDEDFGTDVVGQNQKPN